MAFGVVGSALMIFQALEPFLKLSRFAVWIVEHWRGIVVAPWVWLGALVHIHVPTEVASAITLCIFVATFVVRASPSSQGPVNVEDASTASATGKIPLTENYVELETISLTDIFRALSVPIFLIVVAFFIVRPQSFLGILLTLSVVVSAASWIAMGFSIAEYWIEAIISYGMVLGLLLLLLVLDNLLSHFWILHYYIWFLFIPIAAMTLILPIPLYGADIYLTAVSSAAGARQAVQATMLVIALVCMNWIGLYASALKAWLDSVTALSP